nr:DUF2705 family protein [Fredinandcohnia onubensis]
MLQKKRLFIFVLFTIIIQAIVINRFELIHSKFPFLDGVPITPSESLNFRYLLNWYIPIIGMSFYFSGFLSTAITNYGPSFFVRSYSKEKWVYKQLFSISFHLFLFVCFQTVINLFTPTELSFTFVHFMKLFILYYLTLFILFSIQSLLDLFVQPEISLLIVNLYIIFSILAVNGMINYQLPQFVKYIFMPNIGMGFKNGLTIISTFQMDIIQFNYIECLLFLVIDLLLISILVVKRVKKMDL